MDTRLPNVKDVYFQHKVLTQVHGKPCFESLKILLDELKANASSVTSTLGSGMYGHLGLLLSATRYATLSETAFVTPVNPGPFNPPAQGTGPQIEAAKDVWRDTKFTFELCQTTEKALIAQVVDAIDATYLAALRNVNTSQYGDSIHALTQHLYTTYGRITPQQVKSRELELYNLPFDISLPVDSIFNAIDDLMELSDHAGIPMTADQSVNLAYVIFARQPILLQDLRAWNKKTANEKTWPNMKIHLREAQDDLSSLPVAGSMFPNAQQANFTAMTDQLGQRLLHEQASQAQQQLHELYAPPPGSYNGNDPSVASPPSLVPLTPTSAPSVLSDQFSEMANSMQRRKQDVQSREQNMMTQMQDLMARMASQNNVGSNNNYNRNTNSSSNRNNNHNRGGRGGRNSNSSGRNPSNRANYTRKYCWTHGACAHSGAECNTAATGHNSQATFTNMMDGSTQNCYWLPT